jgi:hypothetical protein
MVSEPIAEIDQFEIMYWVMAAHKKSAIIGHGSRRSARDPGLDPKPWTDDDATALC